MTCARVLECGSGQVVRLPKEFRLTAEQVEILRRGNAIVLRERPASAAAIFGALDGMSADLMADCRETVLPRSGSRSERQRAILAWTIALRRLFSCPRTARQS
jgi:antitoxin VapB